MSSSYVLLSRVCAETWKFCGGLLATENDLLLSYHLLIQTIKHEIKTSTFLQLFQRTVLWLAEFRFVLTKASILHQLVIQFHTSLSSFRYKNGLRFLGKTREKARIAKDFIYRFGRAFTSFTLHTSLNILFHGFFINSYVSLLDKKGQNVDV